MSVSRPTHPLATEFDALGDARHADPFAILGPHLVHRDGGSALVIRACRPGASRVEVVRVGDPPGWWEMTRCHPAGIFEAEIEGAMESFHYRLRISYAEHNTIELDDPYRFGRVLTEDDQYLHGEGTFLRSYEKLGAHLITLGGVRGVHFAVWAPNAERLSVVGDFNGWDGRVHPMRALVPSGLWEIFIPGVEEDTPYKFEIRPRNGGAVFLKTDPYGVYFEHPPNAAAIVRRVDGYEWRDEPWMQNRSGANAWLDRPMSIYEVHLGSWARVPEEDDRFLTYRELAERLPRYASEMGFTHIELLPVMEHPFLGSWGYQVTGFFAPTSRYGPPEDFKYFVDECHRHGLGVFLDWVPGHFPKDAHALASFDGTALYEHEDPRQGEHREWGTLIFNYGRHEVRNFLIANAIFWLREYHVDGLRVDAVASMLYLDYSRSEGEWLPNRYGGRENLEAVEFVRELNLVTHREQPGTVTIAEESTSWPAVSRPLYVGGLGFTYKWNMGWMHDILKYASSDPVHRQWEHRHLTFSMLYAYTENFVLPFSHDEVVHGKGSMMGKMPGDAWQQAANLRVLLGYMYGHPGKKLLFMGTEIGQRREWNHDTSVDWHLLGQPLHAGVRDLVRDLNHVYAHAPALHQADFDPSGFQWIDCNDNQNSVVSLIRRARDPEDFVVMVFNFTPVPRPGYRIGVPRPGVYRERLNSDAAVYGGSNVGNAGSLTTVEQESHGFPHTLELVLPPLAFLLLTPPPVS